MNSEILPRYTHWINGTATEWDGEFLPVMNPATGETMSTVAKGTAEVVDTAVQAARHAFENPKWQRMTGNQRGKLLIKLALLIEQHSKTLATMETQNVGKVLWGTTAEIKDSVELLEYYAGAAATFTGETKPLPSHLGITLHQPVGVCALIVPWNYPLMLAIWKLAPALAAGNAVVLKPSELTPITAFALAELAKEAGFPDGILNIVNGVGSEVGQALLEHPKVDKVSFTGGTQTGKIVMATCAKTLKRLTLELGGKSAAIVFEDADYDAALAGTLFGIYYSAGQSCEARSRILVHKSFYDQFVADFADKAKKIVVGDPMAKGTQMGSLISLQRLEVVNGYVEQGVQEGATLVCGGKRLMEGELAKGAFYAPTLLSNVKNSMTVAQEEIFGPVAVAIPFETEEEAVAIANDSRYGLAGTVWTTNGARALRVTAALKTGLVGVNTIMTGQTGMPFGGWKESGFGRELALETLKHYTEPKSIEWYYGTKPLNPFGL
ncbi:MAG: aldehyde dehydrogenase family protein [bacterium]|nr:aldehyde dehydrogenase family protein [bacterium]